MRGDDTRKCYHHHDGGGDGERVGFNVNMLLCARLVCRSLAPIVTGLGRGYIAVGGESCRCGVKSALN